MNNLTARLVVRCFSVTKTVDHSGPGYFTGKTFGAMRAA
jgi:hypothetical protein